MPYKSGNWRDSHTVTEEHMKLKMFEPNTQSGPQWVRFTSHQQTSLWGRSEMRSALRLRSRLLLMLTGTRAWWRSGTPRCRWMKTVCIDDCALWSFPSIVTCDHLPQTLTCLEFHVCSTSTCLCPCVRWKRHWMSSEFLSLQRQSGRCSPPGWSSLHRAAAWKTNAPHRQDRLRIVKITVNQWLSNVAE